MNQKFLQVVGAIAISVICGMAHAQVNARSMGNMRFHPGMPNPVIGVPTHNQMQPGSNFDSVPALSLTYGIYTFPGTVGSFTAEATKSGHIVGGYGPNVNVNTPANHGFILKGTKFTSLDYPGAVYTQPNAINNAGVIVGSYGTSLLSA